MLSNYVISTIRTYVPILVGLLLTWLASSLHVVINPSSQAGLVALCVAVLSAGYYALVRLLEQRWPSLGFLLGVPAKPIYATRTADGTYMVTHLPRLVLAQRIPADAVPIDDSRIVVSGGGGASDVRVTGMPPAQP